MKGNQKPYPPDNLLNITVFSRTMRELELVEQIFESQFGEVSERVETPLLHHDGRFMRRFDISSNVELFRIESFQKHYSERFEKAMDKSLLLNEMDQIHTKANFLLDFYYKTLSENSKYVIAYRENIPTDFDQRIEYQRTHEGIVVTKYWQALHILFGVDHSNEDLTWTNGEYNYPSDNKILALYCQRLIEFIKRITNQEDTNKQKSERIRIPLAVVALKFIYENKVIPRHRPGDKDCEATIIAKKFGHNSGAALYKQYTQYIVPTDRIAYEGNTSIKTRIKYIEKVLMLLECGKEQANKELELLRAYN